MTTELDHLTALRPPADPPSEAVRARALQALLATIEDEPPGLHHRHDRAGDPDAPVGARGGRRPGHRVRPILRRLPTLAVGLAVLAAAVVMVGAIALLGHGGSSAHPAATGRGHGQILAVGGHRTGISATLRSGLESEYRNWLRAGDDLQTSIHPQLQRVADRALARSVTSNDGTQGAFVAINPQTGAVEAIGSELAPHAAAMFKGIDLATQSAGPTGSVFTPITALAALESGAWSPARSFDDTGQYCAGAGAAELCLHNSGHAAYGVLNLTAALKVQDDDFFYALGVQTNADPVTHPNGGALDTWARNLGIGRKTGIDLPDEIAGTLPTPAWRQQRNRLEHECDTATGPYTGDRKHAPGGCGIADGTDRPWSFGDNENLAVGQGDLQVSPIQLADAYALIANGGQLVTPHVGARVIKANGATVDLIDPVPSAMVPLSKTDLDAVRQGMAQSATRPGGTSDDVFGDFGTAVFGQDGTAQYISAGGRETDNAWYAGYVNATAHHGPLVVVVWIDRGGFGDVAAAPVARQILSQWETGRPGPYVGGTSATT